MRHWPIVLGVLLAVAGLALYLLRTDDVPRPPGNGRAPDPPPIGIPPGTPPGPPAGPASPRKVVMGSLRVTVTAEGPFDGRLLVLGPDDRPETTLPGRGEGRAEWTVPKLKAGPKRVVFVPDGPFQPASARVDVPPDGQAEAALALTAAAVLRGTAVDALQRPLAGVSVEVAVPGAFEPSTTRSAVDVWAESQSAGGGRRPSTPVSRRRMLMSDGRLLRSVTTDDEGSFELPAPPGAAVEAVVTYGEVRFAQALRADGDNRILVPALPPSKAPDPDAARLQEAIHAALRQMALHPDAQEPYAAELRRILNEHLDRLALPPAEKERLRAHVDAIGRPR